MGVDGVRRWAPSKAEAQAQASAIAVMVLGEADGAGWANAAPVVGSVGVEGDRSLGGTLEASDDAGEQGSEGRDMDKADVKQRFPLGTRKGIATYCRYVEPATSDNLPLCCAPSGDSGAGRPVDEIGEGEAQPVGGEG